MSRITLLAALVLGGCHKSEPELAPEPASEAQAEDPVDTLDEAIAASTGDTPEAVAPAEAPGRVVSGQRTRGASNDGAADAPGAAVPADPDEGDPDGDLEGSGDEPVGGAIAAPPEGEDEERGPPPGLEILSNNRWRVPRKLAERWEEHYKRIGRFHQVDDGWRVRVREMSPGWYLGLRSGDVVLSVNGMKLNNKAQLLAAYVKLKKKTEFEVLIRRGGRTVTHRYTIID